MTNEEQLRLGGHGGDQPEGKKRVRKRQPAKPKVKVEASRADAPEPEAPVDTDARMDQLPATEVPSEPEVAPEPEPEPVTPEDEPPVESQPETPAEATSKPARANEPEPIAAVEPAPARLFFLTNRMNLNGLLSSRLLAPRESFHKYYADLLELSPGWVPLLAEPPPAALLERVVTERGAGAPVLVELSESILNGQQPDGPVTYIRAALLADVTAIHFREEKSLREHRARGYSNVFPHEDLLQVSPDLFAGASDSELAIAAPSEAPATYWPRIDRVRGAVSAALAAADSGEALAVAAGLLGASDLPKETILPPWLTWGGLANEGAVPATEGAAEHADRLIFQAAYRVLGERDQAESWSPSEVLEAVTADITSAQPSNEVNAIIERNLRRVRELVNVERDFEPFRNPGSPYVAAKSLLMVLLRPDLGQLLEWPDEETGADETTRVVAAVLAGCLRGVARETIKLRNVALDDRTAAWAVGLANGESCSLGSAEFGIHATKTSLALDGVELKMSEALVPDSVAVYEALSPDARLPTRVAVSRRFGWPVTLRVQIPAGADVQFDDSVVSITSTESVRVEALVDEHDFVRHLQGLNPQRRKEVNALLTSSL